jgi:hypothetical protein
MKFKRLFKDVSIQLFVVPVVTLPIGLFFARLLEGIIINY